MGIIKVLNPGIYASVQDCGRLGFRKFGMPLSGSMDPYAHECANNLLGNPVKAALIEITGAGFSCEFLINTNAAITGADLGAEIDGKPLEPGCVFKANKGSLLVFKRMNKGLRAYFSVAGGFSNTVFLSSMSMQKGERLAAGEVLAGADLPAGEINIRYDGSYISSEGLYDIRVRRGYDAGMFNKRMLKSFFNGSYAVTAYHDRMGVRLACGEMIPHDLQVVSKPVFPGCIQLPGNGEPIIIMNDGQTTGGYPVIAVIEREDLRKAGQLKAGDKIKFSYVKNPFI